MTHKLQAPQGEPHSLLLHAIQDVILYFSSNLVGVFCLFVCCLMNHCTLKFGKFVEEKEKRNRD